MLRVQSVDSELVGPRIVAAVNLQELVSDQTFTDNPIVLQTSMGFVAVLVPVRNLGWWATDRTLEGPVTTAVDPFPYLELRFRMA